MSILFVTDLSQEAQSTASALAGLMARASSQLVLSYIVPAHLNRALGDPLKRLIGSAFRAEVERVSKGGPVEGLLVEKEAPEELERIARERSCDWVAVASAPDPGGPFEGVPLSGLASTLSCPLIAIRRAEPFRVWAAGERPLRVLAGVDRSGTSGAALRWLDSLRRLGELQLSVAQLYVAPEEARRLGLPPPLLAEEQPEVREALERQLAKRLSPWAAGSARLLVRASLGSVHQQLLELASAESADLVVVGSRQRRGASKLWSVSHQLLRLGAPSVAVVPSSALQEQPHPHRICRVLVATDLSPVGNAAVPLAFSVVCPGGEVHLLHVLTGASDEGVARTRAELEALVPLEAEPSAKRASWEVQTDAEVASRIVRTSERLDVDIICLGSRGRGGVKKALLGSVAAEVMARSARPVLIVHPPAV